jgi:hypothetical protein
VIRRILGRILGSVSIEGFEAIAASLSVGTEKEQDRLQQLIFISDMILASRQEALVSLIRLQTLGVSDMEIKNMARLMNLVLCRL